MKKIKLFDVSTDKKINNQFLKEVQKLTETNDWITGEDVFKFENNFSKYLDVNKSVSVNSGTDALEISLRAFGIGPNDKVIIPALSFFATSEAVLKVGAIPIYSDISLKDLNIDINSVKDMIDDKTKAIIPVHLFGNPANMKEIKEFAEKHNLVIIEDVAQAFGSSYEEDKLGSIGNVGCFSFYPTKNLGAYGDGGCVSTNDEEIYKKILILRNHGQTEKYYHEVVGYNSRLDSIQAIILNLKLNVINNDLNKRKNISKKFFNNFFDNENIKVHTNGENPLNLFPISFSNQQELNEVKKILEDNFIDYGIYYPYGLHQFPISQYDGDKIENVEWATKNVITLPNHPNLDLEDVDFICDLINNKK